MERESKYGFEAFSWADEVEKEEEEEAQAQLHQIQKQKTNPFGSARPREVVLQERGIDWRKLDQDLIHLSNIRCLFLFSFYIQMQLLVTVWLLDKMKKMLGTPMFYCLCSVNV